MALVLGTNSYITVADADIYFLDNLQNASWTALSPTIQSQALITGSGQISRAVIDECKLPLVPPIASDLANAAAELGLAMALDPNVVNQGSTGSNTKRVKAGSAEVEFFRPEDGTRFPDTVMDLLKAGGCLGGTGTSLAGIGGSFANGAGTTSTVADPDKYGLVKGYA